MLLPTREKQSIRSVWIQHVSHIGNPNRHAAPIGLGNRRQSRESFHSTRLTLPDLQSHHWALGDNVEHRTQAIGPISLLESPRKPKAAIRPTYFRPLSVNRTPLLAHVLMNTGDAAQLVEFINSQQRAAQRAFAARPSAPAAFTRIH